MAVSISFSGLACPGVSEEIILSGYLEFSFLLDHVQFMQSHENLQRISQRCDYFFFSLSLSWWSLQLLPQAWFPLLVLQWDLMAQKVRGPSLKTTDVWIVWPQTLFALKVKGGCSQSVTVQSAVVTLERLCINLGSYQGHVFPHNSPQDPTKYLISHEAQIAGWTLKCALTAVGAQLQLTRRLFLCFSAKNLSRAGWFDG